ncbi:MAG: hypothetical protein OXI02_02550 [Candidatus Dadabacteria bacterium]|nr:hypothetical protein [Candidatus Dadabacteria bacterium]MDE0476931.1 hypothetical protein [Candidatus Dadabacteria bacterium]
MKIEILAGDWKFAAVNNGVLQMVDSEGKVVRFTKIASLEVATEETKREWKQKVGWGVGVGLVTFGVGGLVTALAVGNKKFVEFFCELPDGKGEFMGKTEQKGYRELVKLCPEAAEAVKKKPIWEE